VSHPPAATGAAIAAGRAAEAATAAGTAGPAARETETAAAAPAARLHQLSKHYVNSCTAHACGMQTPSSV
jgi:hypothetical protein